MARPHLMVLSSGGLRSLVAAATAARREPPPRLSLLHLTDGRTRPTPRRRHLSLAADWLGCRNVIDLPVPHLHLPSSAKTDNRDPTDPLLLPQMLLTAIDTAHAAGADTLIYPANHGDDADRAATVAEQLDLCREIARTTGAALPTLDAPLLEMTDVQVIHLGEQTAVPWHAAWSCLHTGQTPCGACPACLRRRKAFHAARIIDTQQAALAAR